jgi:phosphohistidine phosphatase SixA
VSSVVIPDISILHNMLKDPILYLYCTGVDPEEAYRDFVERREQYASVYQTLEDSDGCSYLKIFDCKKFVVHNIRGYLPLKVVHFCMNLHTLPRTFYLTRHGQSEYNRLGRIGGDSGLSEKGLEYAHRLAKYVREEIIRSSDHDERKNVPARLWTSTLRRTKDTAQFIEHPTIKYTLDNGDTIDWVQLRHTVRRNLDEIYAGTMDGMVSLLFPFCRILHNPSLSGM